MIAAEVTRMSRWYSFWGALGLAVLVVFATPAGSAAKKGKSKKTDATIGATIIAMERAALERWGKGDPSGFLEITAEDVVYFDPLIEKRLDGRAALTQYYEGVRGKVKTDRFELLNPKVQRKGKMAVLTFNFASWSGDKENRWNCTEVYRHDEPGWRIIQTHWSFTRPAK
jgi:ketosteroid isomerase-like protein